MHYQSIDRIITMLQRILSLKFTDLQEIMQEWVNNDLWRYSKTQKLKQRFYGTKKGCWILGNLLLHVFRGVMRICKGEYHTNFFRDWRFSFSSHTSKNIEALRFRKQHRLVLTFLRRKFNTIIMLSIIRVV